MCFVNYKHFIFLFGWKKSKPKLIHRHSKVHPYGNNGNRVCLGCGEKTHSFLHNYHGQGGGDISWGHVGFHKVDEEKFITAIMNRDVDYTEIDLDSATEPLL